MLMPSAEIYNVSCVFKNEVFFSLNYLAEISAIDTLKFSKFLPEIDLIFSKNRLLVYYIFYMYFLKIRLTVFLSCCDSGGSVVSIDKNYDNAGWLEREVSEMFQINFILKKDNRNLLLDYSQNEHPMLKDFPTEGYKDLYYNFVEENLTYLDHNYIEL
jgi:NADH:ubiquinone oxidoreductase subunit C